MSGNYRSVFDIIGPVMVGPSSSHTAGAVAIGEAARMIFQEKPTKVTVHYYESFAKTHRGHGTDFAIAAGVMGFSPDDARVPQAPELAKEAGIDIRFVEEEGPSPIHHPNTAILDMSDGHKHQTQVAGCSVGGGAIEIRSIKIQGVEIHPSGPLPIVLYLDQDKNDPLVRLLAKMLDKGAKLRKEQQTTVRTGNLYEFDMLKYLQPKQVAELKEKFKGIVCLR